MKLWTIQPLSLYKQLQTKGILHCDGSLSEHLQSEAFVNAYSWLAEQMENRISPPPSGVKFPFWAWHTLNWRHKRPDLRCAEFRNFAEPMVCLELELPDHEVLLSDEENWHIVLNNSFYSNADNEADDENEWEWLHSLSLEKQEVEKRKSWERVFDVEPLNSGWNIRGRFVQATFWELRLSDVVSVRHFGKNRSK